MTQYAIAPRNGAVTKLDLKGLSQVSHRLPIQHDPLYYAQRLAVFAIRQVLEGHSLPSALSAGEEKFRPSDATRRLTQELAYGTLRHLGQLRSLATVLADKPMTDGAVEALLWVALYQLQHSSTPAFTVVDQAVEAAAALKKSKAKGFVNAMLRSFMRQRDTLIAKVQLDAVARFSYPEWWISRVRTDYPDRYASILDAGNQRPPLILRSNRRALKRDDYLQMLNEAQIPAHAVGDTGVGIDKPQPVTGLPGYAVGYFSVQDYGAQLAAPLLGVEDGMRVLDACAAPGGKTSHLLELAELDLTALDSDGGRLQRVADNLSRLRLSATLVHGDAANPASWWDGRKFDRILVDAPCSASGIVRRHPDGKWLRRESDIAKLAKIQAQLLDALWPCLETGGRLLYATCSVFSEENRMQAEACLQRNPQADRQDIELPGGSPDQLLPSAAGAAHNHDGFFYALFSRR